MRFGKRQFSENDNFLYSPDSNENDEFFDEILMNKKNTATHPLDTMRFGKRIIFSEIPTTIYEMKDAINDKRDSPLGTMRFGK